MAAFQLAWKLVLVIVVASVATGLGGTVSTVIMLELPLVPLALTALTR